MTQPSRLPLRAPLLPLLAVAALAACRDPLTESDLSGRSYALDRAGAAPPPVLVSAYKGDTTMLLGDTLSFGVPPKAIRTLAYYHHFGAATHVETFRVELEFRLRGAEVEVGSFTPCPPNALCAANLVGVVSDRSIVVTAGNPVTTPSTWRYRRADGQ